jgi:hypothetical protein
MLRTVPRIQNIVTRRLKAGIVEPVDTSIARQRLRQHVPAATNIQAVIEWLLKMMFSIRSASRKVTLTLTPLSATYICKGGCEEMANQFS